MSDCDHCGHAQMKSAKLLPTPRQIADAVLAIADEHGVIGDRHRYLRLLNETVEQQQCLLGDAKDAGQ